MIHLRKRYTAVSHRMALSGPLGSQFQGAESLGATLQNLVFASGNHNIQKSNCDARNGLQKCE